MSLNSTPIEVKSVIDPRLEITNERKYVVLHGSTVNSYQVFSSTTLSNSSIQITCNPPSSSICIARQVFKRVRYDFTVTGTNTSGDFLLATGRHAPRFLPIMATTGAESITINNDTFTQAPVQQYLRALLAYRNEFNDRNGVASMSPTAQDPFQTYRDGFGSVRNPLGLYKDSGFENSRGGFCQYFINTQLVNNTTATGYLIVTEPIFTSPFTFFNEGSNASSLVGVSNMSYQCTFQNLSRILSFDVAPNTTITNVAVNVSSFDLIFNYLTPDPVAAPIPRSLITPYHSIISYPTRTSVGIAPNGTVNVTMQSIQVSSIPKRIYIFAKRDDSNETAFTTDTFFSLQENTNPITVTWNNNQFLASSTMQNLYEISVKNGVNMNFSEWSKYRGSVLALDFGTDIGLMSNQAPGVIGNFQLSITANFRNNHPTETIAPTFYCVVVSEGVMNINSDGSVSHMLGVLSPTDVLNAEPAPRGSYIHSRDIYGGSFMDAMRSVGRFIKDNKLISRGLALIPNPAAQMASRASNVMGLGLSGGNLSNLCN